MNQFQLIGDLLLQQNLITESDLSKGLLIQERIGGRIGSILVRSGSLSENKLINALHSQLQLPRLGEEVALPSLTQLLDTSTSLEISLDWQLDQKVIFWETEDSNRLYYCAKELFADTLMDSFRILFPGHEPEPVLSTAQQLERLIQQLDAASNTDEDIHDTNFLKEMAEDAPIVELVSNFMTQAMERNASDIHIEPGADSFHIRYRIDGILHNSHELPISQFNAVASRVKLISGMDIAEKRLPQDGRMSIRLGGIETDIRISSLPGVFGESIVMRLLPKERRDLELDRLGLAPDHLSLMREWTNEANGIVLVTGPTGSGKSTTLYGALDEANDGIRKIITVEDPVEFQLEGVTQIQVHSDIGLTFANTLRSILRQDPDVIMIGEIRDLETAEIAIQSAMTGHLVLSTLHTNSALDAFTRLIDMGVEPFLVATPLRAVQAQRLVRRLCPQCAQPASEPELWNEHLQETLERLYPDTEKNWKQAVGCEACHHTGYRGRIGIYEMIPVTEELRHLLSKNSSQQQLFEQVQRDGYRSIRDDGLLKAALGDTTFEEVIRVAMNRGA